MTKKTRTPEEDAREAVAYLRANPSAFLSLHPQPKRGRMVKGTFHPGAKRYQLVRPGSWDNDDYECIEVSESVGRVLTEGVVDDDGNRTQPMLQQTRERRWELA